MNLAPVEFLQFFHGQLGGRIDGRTNAEGDYGFHQVKAERLFIEHFGFEIQNRIDNVGREQLNLVRDFGQMLNGVHFIRQIGN